MIDLSANNLPPALSEIVVEKLVDRSVRNEGRSDQSVKLTLVFARLSLSLKALGIKSREKLRCVLLSISSFSGHGGLQCSGI